MRYNCNKFFASCLLNSVEAPVLIKLSGKVKHELRVQIHELRVQIQELRVQIHELRVQFASYEFKFTSQNTKD